MHQAAVAVIVVERIVPCRAVVPEGDRARFPAEAVSVLRPGDMGVEPVEQRLALGVGPAVEAQGKAGIDVQRGPAAYRMADGG